MYGSLTQYITKYSKVAVSKFKFGTLQVDHLSVKPRQSASEVITLIIAAGPLVLALNVRPR